MEEYEFEKKVNWNQIIEEIKAQGLIHDGENAFTKGINDTVIYCSKIKLSVSDEQKLNNVFASHTPELIETMTEKKERLESSIESATDLNDLKEIVKELL